MNPELFYNRKQFSTESSCDDSDWGDEDTHTHINIKKPTKLDQQNFHVLKK